MSKNITQEKCPCGGTCQCGPAAKCNSGKFKRVNFFHGMLLTEEDFVDEQTYLREKLKLHNRLHGAGVVWGLGLEKDCVEISSKGAVEKITKVFIGGGLALDCAGNEIIVCEKYLVPLDEKIKNLRRFGKLIPIEECQPPTYKGPRLYIGISYCECKSQPTEQYTSECPDDKLRPQYSRVREGFDVQVFTAEELPQCLKGNGTNGTTHNCPACTGLYPCREEEQLIILGYVEGYNATSVDDADHRDAKLTDYDNYPTTSACSGDSAWSHPRWEAQRQNALRSVFKQTEWVDVSPIVGRAADNVTEWLTQRKLNLGTIYEPGNIPDVRGFLERTKNAQRWAEPGSTVDLVTGGGGSNCILFLLVNPPAKDALDMRGV